MTYDQLRKLTEVKRLLSSNTKGSNGFDSLLWGAAKLGVMGVAICALYGIFLSKKTPQNSPTVKPTPTPTATPSPTPYKT